MAGEANDANPNLKALVGAVALVLGLAALFTLGGVVGRVQRNEPLLFLSSIAVITLAAGCYLFADLPKGGTRTFLTWAAPALGVVGVLLAVLASVLSTRARERPVVTGSLATAPDRAFTATVKVASLPSDERVAVIVDGLRPAGDQFQPHTVYQAYIGPDQEGRIDHSVTLAIPRLDEYEAVGVKAYTGPAVPTDGETGDTPCESYPRRVSLQKDVVREQGPGCVIIQVPPATDAASAPPSATPRG